MQRPKLSREFVASFLKECIPEYEEMLVFIEENGGNIKLPPEVEALISRFNAHDYPMLYRGKDTLAKVSLLAFFPADEINSISAKIKSLPDSGRTMAAEEFMTSIAEAAYSMLENYPDTPKKRKAARDLFDKMPPDAQAKSAKQVQLLIASFMASFYSAISMMVHGRSLQSLVDCAESGDDDAFLLAVHVDRQILLMLPYFKERHERALMKGEAGFLGKLNYRLSSPLLKGKIRHKTLWLAFAMLDDSGLLDGSLKHREILDICEAAGVGGHENYIVDVTYLTKRLNEYREYQKAYRQSMP